MKIVSEQPKKDNTQTSSRSAKHDVTEIQQKRKRQKKGASDYNKALKNRGKVWSNLPDGIFTPEVWYSPDPNGTLCFFSNKCIEVMLIIRYRKNLPFRQLCGCVEEYFRLMGIDLKVPSYSVICKRQHTIKVDITAEGDVDTNQDHAADSTGLQAHGEGNWRRKKHGISIPRSWVKLHLYMNIITFQILALELTKPNAHDAPVFKDLVAGVEKIDRCYADAAYVSQGCFDLVAERGGSAIIDVRKNMRIAETNPSEGLKQRNEIVSEIDKYGHKGWKEKSGYHQRSLVETQMGRWKNRFGDKFMSRKLKNQEVEARIKAKILNHEARLGLPYHPKRDLAA